MSKLHAWSSKYVTYVDGTSTWVRTNYAARMRDHLLKAGFIETGETLVTGGVTYHEFVRAEAA